MKKITSASIIFILALFLTACTRAYYSPTIQLCRLNLEIFTEYGTNSQAHLVGQVDFGSSTSSYFQGNFIQENGATYPAIFSFDGPAVHFIITGEQGDIFGSGMMESNLYTCSGKGGGTLSGPAVGHLGDWRGEWASEEIPNPQAESTPTSTPVLDAPFISVSIACLLIIVIVGFVIFLRIIKPFSHSTKPATVSMRRPSQKVTSGLGTKPPLVEYLATYIAGDKLFDLSIDIERSERYLGECGVSTSNHIDKAPGQATGFEIWLFDPASAETVSKSLMSEYCYRFESPINAGQVFLIGPHIVLQLETHNLMVKAEITEIEYESGSSYPNSVIKKAVIKIEAWEKAGSTWS